MTGVSVRNLDAGYAGTPVLHDLSLQAAPGEFVAVVGASGSGKTTLLRALAGFIRPTGGQIEFGERVVAGPGAWVPPEHRRVGIVPQEGALFPHLDVYGNVAFGIRKETDCRSRVMEMLDLVGLADRIHARPQELSGGQMQRVAIARALAPRPEVVLLDEPFSALDASLRATMRSDVRLLLSTLGTTSILVTHDQQEALSMANRVAVVSRGRVTQCDTPANLYDQPVDLQTARFVGDIVEFPATRIDEWSVMSALGAVQSSNGVSAQHDAILAMRPEQLAAVREDEQDCESGAGGRVISIAYHGHDSVISVALDVGHQALVRVAGPVHTGIGDRVRVIATAPGRVFQQ
jgi:iron(III) transport system ATP-binding protein